MALTKAELMIAADAAEKYPEGVKPKFWGYGPMKVGDAGDAAQLAHDHLAYG